jgi:hypothetical protein
MTYTDLTSDQKASVDMVSEILSSNIRNVSALINGFSGTGKSTIIPLLVNLHNKYASTVLLAPTNKALGVIRAKTHSIKHKVEYSTVHKILYGKPDDTGVWVPKNEISENIFLIIDECSMISLEMQHDINKKFRNCFILYIGDNYQLEAIGNNSTIFDLPHKVQLTQVVRHDGGVLDTVTHIRQSKSTEVLLNDYVTFMHSDQALRQFATELYHGKDSVLICATNNARIAYNKVIRDVIGKPKTTLQDDQLICINNNTYYSNGETFRSGGFSLIEHQQVIMDNGYAINMSIYSDSNGRRMLLCPDTQLASLHTFSFKNMPTDQKIRIFGAHNVYAKLGLISKDVIIATYGYAVSCHKLQGSQFDSVYVDFDYCAGTWNPSRWLYTAISRAAKRACIIPNKNVTFINQH